MLIPSRTRARLRQAPRTAWYICIALTALAAAVTAIQAARAADPAPGAPQYNVEIVVFRANSPVGVAENWQAESSLKAANSSPEHGTGETSVAAPAVMVPPVF